MQHNIFFLKNNLGSEMKLRSKLLPRVPTDLGAFIFILTIIPIIYWFEVFIVLPSVYAPWSLWFTIHFAMGTFLMVNIASNYLAVVIVDTSINGHMINPGEKHESKLYFCSVCECLIPPRSWHCNDCGICILKREHHCIFTGCCVGHYNHRYFIMFLIYMTIATTYGTYFNSYFIWNEFEVFTPYSLLKLLFPAALLLWDTSVNQLYLMLYAVNVAGILFAGSLLIYHLVLLKSGQVTHENTHSIHIYNFGLLQNIKEVLGDRWFLVWIFPSIVSELPHDGITWKLIHKNIKTDSKCQ